MVQALTSAGRPLSLASADFNEDSVTDLAVGYAAPGGGIVALYKGNLDAFAPQSHESFQGISQNRFPSPFFPNVGLLQVPGQPDFLGAGQLIGDNHIDLIVGARGDSCLYVFPGKGNLTFDFPSVVTLPGKITSAATGKLGVGSKFSQILVGITTANGSALLVLTGSDEGLVLVAAYPLQAPAAAFAFGDLNSDTRGDAAIVSGGNLFVLDGRAVNPATPDNNGLKAVSLPFSVSSIALGSFAFDRNPGLQMALLSPDGNVHIVAHSAFDPRPFTAIEMNAKRLMRGRNTQASANHAGATTWSVIETIPAVGVSNNPRTPALLMRTRISSNGSDDIVVLNPAASQMVIVSHPNPRQGLAAQTDGSFALGAASVRFYGTGTPVAALAMRVNIDARPGLVVLHQGQLTPSVMMPLPDPVFTVNTTTDLVSANPSACLLGLPGQCSLRQAIIEANATGGADTILVPSGTYKLTSAPGHLDIFDWVNIVGADPATTIIQSGVGTDSSSGIDKIFSISPLLNPALTLDPLLIPWAFDTHLTNLTIRYGNNALGGGGAFDWEAYGTGNLIITNCTITDNSTVNSDGGGIHATNSMGNTGLVTITNSTIQNNKTSATGTSGRGGGLYLGPDTNLLMSNTQVLTNQALNPTNGNGGGIFVDAPTLGPPSNVIHANTISNNTAALDGGGIYTNAGLTIDQATLISNNTATNGDGGGLWSSVTDLVTLTTVAITGNTAHGKGGGIQVGASTTHNSLTMHFSRIAGNKAAGVANAMDYAPDGTNTGQADLTNNWWGSNSPPITTSGGASPACPVAAGNICYDPYIVLTNTAGPSPIKVGDTSTVTASFLQDSQGGTISPTDILVLIGLPASSTIFPASAVHGDLSSVQTSVQANGMATETFTATSAGVETINATVDQASVAATISVLLPPSITKAFSVTHIPVFTFSPVTATLTFTITNSNTANALHGLAFTDNLPSGLAVANTANVSNTCGGTATATTTAGIGTITLLGGTINQNTTCTVSVDVKGVVDGLQNSTSSNVTATDAGGLTGNVATASITVVNPPTISKAFSATTIALNSTATLTFTLQSTNANLTLTGVAFTDTLPAGLTVASATSTVCGGTLTTTVPTSIALSGASLAPGTTCLVTVTVTGTTPGVMNNTTGAISATETGAGNPSNTATITVVAPPVLSKLFAAANIPLTGSTSLSFTIQNLNATLPLNGVSFVDTLAAGLAISTPNGLSGSCGGGTITATQATNVISLTGAVLPTGSCNFSVNVDGILAGQQNNLTSVVTSVEGGTGAAASASITVVAPPAIAKAFSPNVISLNGNSTLTFVVGNPAGQPLNNDFEFDPDGTAIPNITGWTSAYYGYNDCGTRGNTPSGSQQTAVTTARSYSGTKSVYSSVQNANGQGGCGDPNTRHSTVDLTSAPFSTSADTLYIWRSDVSYTTSSRWAWWFAVDLSDGVNTQGVMLACKSWGNQEDGCPGNSFDTQDRSDTGTDGQTWYRHSIPIPAGWNRNNLTVTIQHFQDSWDGTTAQSSLYYDLVTGNQGPGVALTGVAFTDNLPAGSVVASTPAVNNTCVGGSVTAAANSSSVALSGATLAAGALCKVAVNVTGTASGVLNNSVQATSTEGGAGNTASANLTVNKADTTTTVISSANPSVFGQSVTFTATVSASGPGSGTPTGTVTFLDNGTSIGSGTLIGGVATLTTTALAVSSHPITTNYPGDGSFNSSTGSLTGNPQVVNKAAATTAVLSSVNPSVFGQSVTFTATVSASGPGAGTPTGTVGFYDGASQIGTGTLSGGIATFTTTALDAGSHPITTNYAGDGDFNSSTGSLTGNPQVVNKAAATTAVLSSLNPSTFGQSVTFTATVSASGPGAGTPTGTVGFYDGASQIGTGTLIGGVATLTTTALDAGSHPITTNYAGDGDFNSSTGSLTGNPQVVNKAATTTAVVSSGPTHFGESVTFTATVSSTAGTPTGNVTFLDGITSLGPAALSSGVATFSAGGLALGTHSITAQYLGNSDYVGSTSAATSQDVTAPAITINTGGSSSTPLIAPVTAGGSGTLQFTLDSAGTLTTPITFSCLGLPTGAQCVFSPDKVDPASLPVTVTVTITTTRLEILGHRGPYNSPWSLAVVLPAVCLLPFACRRGKRR